MRNVRGTRAPHVLCASCTSWMATLPVPQLLHRAGARVSFLGPRAALTRRSRFVDTWIPSEEDPVATVRTLERHLGTHDYAWVVIGDDLLLAALRARADEAWVRAILPVPADPVRLALLGSKTGFVRSALALGLPIPESHVCRGRKELERALRALGGTAILKEDEPSGGEGCHLVQGDADQLPDAMLDRPVVLQRYLSGSHHAVDALYDRGALRSVQTSQIVRAWPSPFGASAARRFSHCEKVVALAQEIGRKVGLHGFANISMINDPCSQELLLFELDPRPNLWFFLADALGIATADAARGLLARSEVGTLRHVRPDHDTVAPIFPTDVIRCVDERDWRALYAWICNADGRWRFAPKGDLRLTLALIRFVLTRSARALVSAPPACARHEAHGRQRAQRFTL